MFKFYRKARLFPDETPPLQRLFKCAVNAKNSLKNFIGESAVPDLFYFFIISSAFAAGGLFLLPEGTMRFVCVLCAVLFTPICLPFCVVSKNREIKRRDEAIYIEHLSYLYCKGGDFEKALREVRSFYPRGRMKNVLGEALDMLSHDIGVEAVCHHIEKSYDSMRIRILHKFICAYEDGRRSVIPVEILASLYAYRKEEVRMGLEKFRDRTSICLVAGMSVIICLVIMIFLQRSGLMEFEAEFDRMLFLMMVSFMMFFLAYEVLNLREGEGWNRADRRTYVCADFLRCIMPLFLVRRCQMSL